MNVQIRWLIRRDMPEILEIERLCFEQRWTEEDFLHVLRQRTCIGMVAEHNHRIVGFMVYDLHKNMISIMNLAVHPDYQNKRVGTQLVKRVKDKLSLSRRREIILEVREKNLPAQVFFRKMRFRAVSVLRNYFEDVGEDAYLMVYKMERQDCEYAPGYEPSNRISNYIEES